MIVCVRTCHGLTFGVCGLVHDMPCTRCTLSGRGGTHLYYDGDVSRSEKRNGKPYCITNACTTWHLWFFYKWQVRQSKSAWQIFLSLRVRQSKSAWQFFFVSSGEWNGILLCTALLKQNWQSILEETKHFLSYMMNQARRLCIQFSNQNSLKIEYIHSQGFIGYPGNRVHRDYDVIERHGSSGFGLALPFRCLHGADWTVQTYVNYFLVPANCLKSDSV